MQFYFHLIKKTKVYVKRWIVRTEANLASLTSQNQKWIELWFFHHFFGEDFFLAFRAGNEDGTAAVAKDVDCGTAHVEDAVDGDEQADPFDRKADIEKKAIIALF